MDEMWGPVIGSLGFTMLIITPIIVNKIIKFKLELAKINAETTIKAEEIRARNQLDIEKLMKIEKNALNQIPNTRFTDNEELYESPDKIKRRI